jgi:small GTP-binding protein
MTVLRMKAKVAIVGDSGVGKTSLIRRFVLDEYDDKYIHTVGTKVTKVKLTIPHGVDTEVDMDMSIFDIMGQKGFRDMVKDTYFHDMQGLLAVCDLTNRQTLDVLQDWIATALESGGDAPVYILVNKDDLRDKAQFGDEAISKVARPWNAPYVFTSAKSGASVDDAFNALAIEIVTNAMRTVKARAVSTDIDDRILQALALRGFLGLTKNDLFQRFKGIQYDELKAALDRLERQILIQMNWRGPAEFTVLITPKGLSSVKDKESPDTGGLSSV